MDVTGALLCMLLAQQPRPLEVSALPVGPVRSFSPKVGLAIVGSSAYVAWADDRLAQASRARFPGLFEPPPFGNSLWLSEFDLAGPSPSRVTQRLVCTGTSFGDLVSPKLVTNGTLPGLMVAFVEQDRPGNQRVRLARPFGGTPCGIEASPWYQSDPVDELQAVRVGDRALVSWQTNGTAVIRWFDFDGTPRSPAGELVTGVDGRIALGSTGPGAGAEAIVAWAQLPGATFTLVSQLSTNASNLGDLSNGLTQINGMALTDPSFLLSHTATGLYAVPYAPFSSGSWALITPISARTPLLVRTSPQSQLAAIAETNGTDSLMVLESSTQRGPKGALAAGLTVEALDSSGPHTVVALTDTTSASSLAKVSGGAQRVTPPTLSARTTLAEARPLQRTPSVAWAGDAWLVAWEELELTTARTAQARFAKVTLDGGVFPLTLANPNLVNPTLLQRPGGRVAVVYGSAAARRAGNVSVVGPLVSVALATVQAAPFPSALVGERRTVQWGSDGFDTSFKDSALPDGALPYFSAGELGVATPEELWLLGQQPNPSGVLMLHRLADVANAPEDFTVRLLPAAADGALLNVAARTTDAGTELLLGWVDPAGKSQLGTFKADAGLLPWGEAPVNFKSSASLVGVEQGWFMAGADGAQGTLLAVLVSPAGLVLETDPTPMPTAAQPFVAAGPGGSRAVTWAEFRDGTSVVYLKLYPGQGQGSDGGTSVDGGSSVDGGTSVDGGSSIDGGALVDGGSSIDGGALVDGGSSIDGGTLVDGGAPAGDAGPGASFDARYGTCGCGSGSGAPLVLLAAAALRRARRPRRALATASP